jgi:atypical dual specificity phosphatase
MLAFPFPTSSLISTARSPSNRRIGRSATLILPKLYLSDLSTARDENVLRELEITHVVSVMEYPPSIPGSIPDEKKLHVSIADRSDVNVLVHLEKTTEFIKQALSESPENKVLVSLGFSVTM